MMKTEPQSMKARKGKLDDARRYLAGISKAPLRDGAMQYAPPLDQGEVLAIAAEILGHPLPSDPRSGRYYLTCPGVSMHSGGKSGRKDCEFLPNGAPTLRCFHESCEAALTQLNFSIRSACGKAKMQKFTDATARATQAADALIIGFDMADDEVKALLAEWGRSCDPQIPPADLSAALKSAKRSYTRASTDDIGCLLRGRAMPARRASPRPPREEKLSVVSTGGSVSKPALQSGVGLQEPIYVGAKGQLAKEVRELVEDFKANNGKGPHTILIGTSYEGVVPARLVGIQTERWQHREHSVVG